MLSIANEVQQGFVAFAKFLDYGELIDALERLTKRTGCLSRPQAGVGDVVRKKASSRQRINRSNREGGSSK
jgi:hypothetical protein